MGVKLAKTAGFCMGVRRAVDMVLDMARQKGVETIYTYGPLIHNPQTVELLLKRGIVPIRCLEEIEEDPVGAAMVIRAHGISPAERKKIQEKGFRIVDATCPRVAHVQAIIRKHAGAGYTVLIIGDREHPEVNGLLGFAGEAGIVLGSPGEVDRLPTLAKVCVVAQTTQSLEEYATMVRRIRKRFPAAVVFDTICNSTEKRQTEIKSLAAGTDAVFIVGGRNSANTQRLTELAKHQGKPAFHIETADELSGIDIEPYRRIGVSAGASTPNWIIDRVVDHLTGRLGKREEFLRDLFKIWVFAVRTDIYSAAGAGCLSLAAMLIQGLPVNLLHILTASLYVYAMHILNRFINRKASSISSFREESYLLHEKIYVTLAVLAMILALSASFVAGPAPFILLFTLSLSGVLYNTRFLPPGWRFQSLKDIPGSKNIATAVAWAAVTAILPRIETGLSPTPGLAVAFVFTAGIVFIRSALSDILDIQSDRLIGRETLPVLIGERRTLILLQGISGLLFVLLLAASPAGWSTTVSFVLLTAVFYIWICFKLYDRRSGFSGVVLEGLLESSYIVAGVSALLWFMATGDMSARTGGFEMTNAWAMAVIASLLLSTSGCGGLRYSEVSPEAKDFHPRGIAVLPADVKAFPEAKGSIDRLFAEALTEKGWFAAVVGGEAIDRRLTTDETLRQTVGEYLAKLDKVSFSDPALSARIGELTRTEALLLVRVDYWNYTTENDKKVGKVNLSTRMIAAATGKTIWAATHFKASDYLIIKPDLPDVGRDLIREMIGHMPH